MKGKIEKSHKRYMKYDPNIWVGEYFDDKTGGYVVVNLRRLAHSEKSNGERGKYIREFDMAKVFAKNGHQMEMLDENSGELKNDVNINGVPADMKRIKTNNNIMRAASKALKRQNSRVVLFQFDQMTERVYLDLLKLRRRHYKILYFFTEEGIVYDLDTATPRQLSGRGGDPSAPQRWRPIESITSYSPIDRRACGAKVRTFSVSPKIFRGF